MSKKEYLIISALILLILLTILFNLGYTSTQPITTYLQSRNQTAAVSDFDSNLILHYTFDDGTATDSSGKGNNGTLVGAVTGTSGVVGQALQFNGSDSYIDVSSSVSIAPPFTISAWVYLPSSLSGGGYILSKQTGAGNPATGISLSSGCGNACSANMNIYQADQTPSSAYTPSVPKSSYLDGWHFITAYSDGQHLTTCIDTTTCSTSVAINGFSPAPSQHLVIGIKSYNHTSAWPGKLDDLRIYDRVLPSQEITNLYNLGSGQQSGQSSGSGTPPPADGTPSTPPADTTSSNPPRDQQSAITPTTGAKTYTVKKDGTGDFTTIKACAMIARAGNTCLIYPGTYDERVTVTSSGTAGNPITFEGSGSAKLIGFTIDGMSYITIKNLELTHAGMTPEPYPGGSPSASIFLLSTNHIQIVDNVIHDTEGKCIYLYGLDKTKKSDYVSIQNNRIYKCGAVSTQGVYGASGIMTIGDHILVENNDISHSGADFMNMTGGNYNVFRKNYLHDNSHADGPPGDIDHIDGLQNWCAPAPADLATHHLLIENNTMVNAPSPDTHFTIFQDQGNCGSSEVVIRYNTVSNVGSGFIINNQKVSAVRIYGNTAANVHVASPLAGDVTTSWTNITFSDYYKTGVGTTDGKVINNIWYNTVRNYGNEDSVEGPDPSRNKGSSFPGYVADNNMAYNATCGATCSWHNPLIGISPPWTNPETNVLEEAHSIVNKNPLFTNLASNIFSLQPSSPAIDAGGPLTTIASTDPGSGSTITVSDVGFFQDGWAGVQPDWIAVGTTGNSAQIRSINYTSNTITLDRSLPRHAGDPVYLYKDSSGRQVLYGNAPDIGAYEYPGTGTTQPPPTTPTADFNHDGKVNSLDFSLLQGSWNQSSIIYDLNHDGTVNTLDYSLLIQQWTG